MNDANHNNTCSYMPYVSVIMPVYNGAFYLEAAIESILGQTYEHFEFIIVDDGSTDSTREILDTYAAKHERIVLAQNNQNLGLVSTLNKGIALAQGKYIARMDADDISHPERLEMQVAFLEAQSEVGVVGTAYYRVFDDGTISLRHPPTSHTAIRWNLLFGNTMCHPSVMLRRVLVDLEQPFYRDFRHVEDYELWCRLLKHTKAATLDTPLLYYRVHSNSVSSTYVQIQHQMVEVLSVKQIEALLPGRFTPLELSHLRDCHSSKQVNQEQLAICSCIFELFEAFAHQPDIDSSIVWQLRRYWSRRFWARVPVEQFPQLIKWNLFHIFLRHEPTAILIGLAYMVKSTVRQLLSRKRASLQERVTV